MRRIVYISGTRADFGLMKSALDEIEGHPALSLSLYLTGMHLLPEYGDTWTEVRDAGFHIGAKVPVELSGGEGAEMALALGSQIQGFTLALQSDRPDIVLLLGDRGEMLAAAIAALHLSIPVVHIHGGELSGTVDEPVRHAISKLAHYHFTSTAMARERLIRMGELPDNIIVTGAPGLDSIVRAERRSRAPLFEDYGLDSTRQLALVLFHPVVQQAASAAEQMDALLKVVLGSGLQSLVIMPNADAGSAEVARVIQHYAEQKLIRTVLHVPREDFLSLMTEASLLAGNSSSGIIEAASLGTPVLNIGDRQRCRERNDNVVDTGPDEDAIREGLEQALKLSNRKWTNVYGDGSAGQKIAQNLADLSLAPGLLEKVNAY
ncbi:UDP-N-acetylglucosamine 2-epimerase [Marinobacterium jannaschii]|uniref:UDP-N-acetylglucosamine 2-epimerase n=1 Tax=Marinobacterium jannaschii TaxID=64970 RepID=UPI000484082F|nr:UDP-N-acetylglucosamine 2-epimerase [Marinobacterium jannaschii]